MILAYVQEGEKRTVITAKDSYYVYPQSFDWGYGELGKYDDGVLQLWRLPKGDLWLSDKVERLKMVSLEPLGRDLKRSELEPPMWLKIFVKLLEVKG